MSKVNYFKSSLFSKESVLGENKNQGRITYLATNKATKSKVVLKEFFFGRDRNWDSFKSLEKEFNILSKLNSPKIPKYLGWYETEESCILVQEYFEAPCLENRSLPQKEVWEIAKQILTVLEYLESQQIIHKDIKPANILWDGKTAYLVDFGFSSNLNLTPGASSTLLGTLGFMPPEQLYRGTISHQGDLYSLGVTLFCLLNNIQDYTLISNYLDSTYTLDAKSLKKLVSKVCLRWIERLICQNLNRRFKSASEAIAEFPNDCSESEFKFSSLINLNLSLVRRRISILKSIEMPEDFANKMIETGMFMLNISLVLVFASTTVKFFAYLTTIGTDMSVDSQKATKELLIDPDRKVYSQYHSCKRKKRGDFVEKTLKGDWDTYTDSYSLATEARIHEDCLQELQNNGK